MNIAQDWFNHKGWNPYPFQEETWQAMAQDYSGLLNAPTGYGKTYALWFGVLSHYYTHANNTKGLHCLWISPLKALSKEIHQATQKVSEALSLNYTVGLRTGDTPGKERVKQTKSMPHALITTPESVHLLLSQKNYSSTFKNLEFVIVDEWHELMGSKRGVLVELALSRLKAINPNLKIWGISATIGNLEEAKDILLGTEQSKSVLVKSTLEKKIQIETILPEVVEKYPWAGHLGIHLLPKVLPIIYDNNATLIFTNTRSQCEIWYQRLLENDPNLAGVIALHHGSLSEEVRQWVESALHEGKLKVVVCTSSLDLGVDFRPVDTVIQIGSPKGVARFMQRAGRSGHQPGALSKIYFLPTHSFEIIEGSAIRYAIANKQIEHRIPYIRSFDVLIQYLVTLAVSDGFDAKTIYDEVTNTHCFASITPEEFNWCLDFITHGGHSLEAYDEYHKVEYIDGLYKVTSKRVAMRHRMSVGVIVSDTMMHVKYLRGNLLGLIEEGFIARLKPGDVFWFAGRNLSIVRVQNMVVYVRKAKEKKGIFPSWMGGRMPLSSQLTTSIRQKLDDSYYGKNMDEELSGLVPLFEQQKNVSLLPSKKELLIEKINTKEGCHLFVYPFEGRNVHEGLASLFAYRIAKLKPMTFSLAFNDYGLEILSDQDIPIEEAIEKGLFSTEQLSADISASVNVNEMTKRRFREIASIAGLVFKGFPGAHIKMRHLQASSQLFYSVFTEYDKNNLLLKEAYDEVMTFQMEQDRLWKALHRMGSQKIVVSFPKNITPFAFPIYAENFREKLSTESFEEKIKKILLKIEK